MHPRWRCPAEGVTHPLGDCVAHGEKHVSSFRKYAFKELVASAPAKNEQLLLLSSQCWDAGPSLSLWAIRPP